MRKGCGSIATAMNKQVLQHRKVRALARTNKQAAKGSIVNTSDL